MTHGGLAATPYAAPREVHSLEECWFYHTVEVPGFGVVEGPWDLRAGVREYLGGIRVRGKRVLELGTASGFVGFFMEREGAEVVAYDLSEECAQYRNIVPYAAHDWREAARSGESFLRVLNNSYWLCHRAFRSSARVVYGDIYDVPDTIGPVDIATFGCLLLHLRDPFRALASAARLVRETIVVTEPDWYPAAVTLPPCGPEPAAAVGWRRRLLRLAHKLCGDPLWQREVWLQQFREHVRLYGEGVKALPMMAFVPDYRRGEPKDGWWHLAPPIVCEFLGVLGFENTQVSYHTQPHRGQPTPMFTVVGHR